MRSLILMIISCRSLILIIISCIVLYKFLIKKTYYKIKKTL